MNKLKILTLVIIASLLLPLKSFGALNTTTNNNNKEQAINFDESLIGGGLVLGKRIDLASQILLDVIHQNQAIKDTIFSELEIFANKNLSGEINHQYGLRFNLGYEIEKFRIYPSIGYLKSKFQYEEDELPIQKITSSSPFFGFGVGYDISDTISLRINSYFYNIDAKPDQSSYRNIEVNVASTNLDLAIHF